jgi:LysR family glycine cleavage system transcriptional activator
MPSALPPLNALRAFEAAARHGSLTKAAGELKVTPGALSHQIRGLEELLQVALFERHARGLVLTAAGRQLQPGLQSAFQQIRQALGSLGARGNDRVLVISTPPGFTAKWLAPRLHRFVAGHPEIDVRITSSMALANFTTDGIDVAIRNMRDAEPPDPALHAERLVGLFVVPVSSPGLLARIGPLAAPEALREAPLVHDDSLAQSADMPDWSAWFEKAGVEGIDLSRGLHFSSSDHALEAAIEGAGVLLANGVLAFDDLRAGRLVMPFDLMIPFARSLYLVCPKGSEARRNIAAFRAWIAQEIGSLDMALLRKACSGKC